MPNVFSPLILVTQIGSASLWNYSDGSHELSSYALLDLSFFHREFFLIDIVDSLNVMRS